MSRKILFQQALDWLKLLVDILFEAVELVVDILCMIAYCFVVFPRRFGSLNYLSEITQGMVRVLLERKSFKKGEIKMSSKNMFLGFKSCHMVVNMNQP